MLSVLKMYLFCFDLILFYFCFLFFLLLLPDFAFCVFWFVFVCILCFFLDIVVFVNYIAIHPNDRSFLNIS